MCGIVGYIGKKQAYDVFIHELQRLEYKGYDSAGIAIGKKDGTLNVYKSKGKVAELESSVERKDIEGTIGIAHTRWATHGELNDVNAHPHISEDRMIALVHNGTIENYGILKTALTRHRPIALIDSEMLTVIITPSDSLYEKIISNVQQVKSCGGSVIAIVSKGNRSMEHIADYCPEIPEVPECLTPIIADIPLQLLAYYIAINIR